MREFRRHTEDGRRILVSEGGYERDQILRVLRKIISGFKLMGPEVSYKRVGGVVCQVCIQLTLPECCDGGASCLQGSRPSSQQFEAWRGAPAVRQLSQSLVLVFQIHLHLWLRSLPDSSAHQPNDISEIMVCLPPNTLVLVVARLTFLIAPNYYI